jgi:prepilin peptidase CpaA
MLSHAPALLAGVALVLVLGAAMHDVATRTVPNWFSAGIAAAGLLMRLCAGDLMFGLIFASVVFAGATLLWWLRLMGGADAKLFGATALAVSPVGIPGLLIFTALAGGVLALAYLISSRMVRRPAPGRRRTLLGRIAKAELWRLSRRGPLPYATAIAAGSAVTLSPQLWG